MIERAAAGAPYEGNKEESAPFLSLASIPHGRRRPPPRSIPRIPGSFSHLRPPSSHPKRRDDVVEGKRGRKKALPSLSHKQGPAKVENEKNISRDRRRRRRTEEEGRTRKFSRVSPLNVRRGEREKSSSGPSPDFGINGINRISVLRFVGKNGAQYPFILDLSHGLFPH